MDWEVQAGYPAADKNMTSLNCAILPVSFLENGVVTLHVCTEVHALLAIGGVCMCARACIGSYVLVGE